MRWWILAVVLAVPLAGPAGSFQGTARSIAGTVRSKVSGAPVAGAEVTLLRGRGRRGGGFEELASRTTGPDGTFRFEGLEEEGSYGIRVRAKEMAVTAMAAPPGAESPRSLEVELEPELRLRGRVVEAADGTPVAGAEVSAGFFASTTTGPDGRFELGGLSPSAPRVNLQVRQGDHLPASVELPGGTGPILDAGEIRLAPGGRVDFTLRDDDRQPVPRAEALLYRLDLRRFPLRPGDRATATGGEDGAGSLRGLLPGVPFVIRFAAPGFPPHVFGPFTIPEGETVLPLDLRMTRGIALSGRVVDDRGAPPPPPCPGPTCTWPPW